MAYRLMTRGEFLVRASLAILASTQFRTLALPPSNSRLRRTDGSIVRIDDPARFDVETAYREVDGAPIVLVRGVSDVAFARTLEHQCCALTIYRAAGGEIVCARHGTRACYRVVLASDRDGNAVVTLDRG